MTRSILSVVAIVALAPLGCQSVEKPAPVGGEDVSQHAEPSWGYEPHNGPEHWGTLDPAFSVCSTGEEQSPIDLTAGRNADPIAIEFEYPRTRIAIENNGHTIQVNPDPGRGIVLNGVRFHLLQFHFHHASEHTVDGIQFPLEMHLVHRNDGGSLAVVGVLFQEGPANDALAPVWAHLPTEQTAPDVIPGELDLASLLPAARTTWRYRGSLTTPPCTEGVNWIVLTEPLTMSPEQIAAFGAIYPNNFRPVQPLGKRVLDCG
ncbi:MAG: carbonic anhydrase family protein [Candidatus Aminicenantes bacterium]|nr:carbonic anhydrase family protein [Candidatus Aminicenantes bacterium]